MKLFPIIFLISIISFGQNQTPSNEIRDSIFYYLNTSENQTNNSLRAIRLSKSIKNDSLLFTALVKYGLAGYSKKDTTVLKKAFLSIKELHKKNRNPYFLAKEHHFKALFYRIQFKLDSSYSYYHKSKNIYKKIGDSTEVGKRLLSMGYMQNDEKDYVGAQSTIIEALRYLEPLDEIIILEIVIMF